ncbi:MSMEG_0570 family protein [Novosphingobium sp. CF614]|uniref:MSMEG_0570 family nitrogen starvation response protein n=1 Tax=Novosphingobium sp. CF614 TaxID=1884364 RepID=UPI0008EE9BEA|nr:MSMEG_0570 family nitrogen starvation response protein [Novosphingobium sp. CF614]SFG37447.1 MSMEG_0570 family protein [Novosphingobium sp. CF614]
MPEMRFRVRWPDGSTETCYSPSTVITQHLEAGIDYPLPRFVERARAGLEAANERVRGRFGMGCSQALNQIAAIEQAAAAFAKMPTATVRVEGFEL